MDVSMWRFHRGVGMGPDQLVPVVTDADVDVDALAESHDAIYSSFWLALRLVPGAPELVQRCHDRGLITVLASSAGAREVQVIRDLLDAEDALDHTTSSDNAEDSKPAPDLVAVPVQRAGVDPSDAVFVGDAIWDVRACGRAGVACIGLECGGSSAAEFQAAGAVEVYGDPMHQLARFDASALRVIDMGRE